MMDDGWKGLKLPVTPGGMTAESILAAVYDSAALGEHYLLFRRVSAERTPEIKALMTPEDWVERERLTRRFWAAECRCTRCQGTFLTGYIKGGGILLQMLENDETASVLLPNDDTGGFTFDFLPGERALCPECRASVEVQPFREVRAGRTWQVLQPEMMTVDDYDVVIYWLVSRTTCPDGDDAMGIFPRDALIVDRAGMIRRMTWRDGMWQPCGRVRDPEQIPYYSWDAANHRQVGGWGFDDYPETLNGTGEKTALEAYAGEGGVWPGRYLLLWQKHPNVENLMRQGFAFAVTDAIDRKMENAGSWRDLEDVPSIPWIDWNEVKPHRMLHMSREAWREIRKARWCNNDAAVWRQCESLWPGMDARTYERWRLDVGSAAVMKLLDMVRTGWRELEPGRVLRYLGRQGLADSNGVDMLIDYRRMRRMMPGHGEETEEIMWPGRLQDAHDRVAEWCTAHQKMKLDEKFGQVYENYRALEWTDGSLCIRLPRREAELIREGEVLRHCVGTYGEDHISGRLIFFVRHYRRPERSYYTLNIDMSGGAPREIQLHGYGNERHGVHKEKRHRIPGKVRDFVDRWERDVLTPWFAERKAQRRIGKKKKEGKTA